MAYERTPTEPPVIDNERRATAVERRYATGETYQPHHNYVRNICAACARETSAHVNIAPGQTEQCPIFMK
jgi:hypothetical protein